MTDVYDILKLLWDAYGKNHNENQIRLYAHWAQETDYYRLRKAVDFWIGNEKFFPALSDLKRTYSAQNNSGGSTLGYEDCWYCGGVGLVPSIEIREGRHYITNYKCKCSNAVMGGVQEYFKKYNDVEYGDYAHALGDECTYPQAVDRYFKELVLTPKERTVEF
tara:strand:+ start:218 stop:706 length:489 start_codon:yes stop_codon:yes gene_type:complete